MSPGIVKMIFKDTSPCEGHTAEIIKDYTRDSVTQLIDTYPDLTGLGTALGERMKGMTPAARQQWIADTYGEGMLRAKRKIRFIYRLPFSATADGRDSASQSVQQMTREGIEAMDVMKPVWVEAKYNRSHAHATTRLVHVHGGELKDTYWNPPPENYKITWMARNEDFFALRWGQSDFIREHLGKNNQEYVGGYYARHPETYIPAKDYFTKKNLPRPWKYAFERQWMFYSMWGNLLYNPATPDSRFIADWVRRFGFDGESLFTAQKIASRTPLRIASFIRSSWDYTLYSEGLLSITSENKGRFITIDDLIRADTL